MESFPAVANFAVLADMDVPLGSRFHKEKSLLHGDAHAAYLWLRDLPIQHSPWTPPGFAALDPLAELSGTPEHEGHPKEIDKLWAPSD